MASSNFRDRAPEQRPPSPCETCCHYCQQVASPSKDAQQASRSSDAQGFFLAIAAAMTTLLILSTANAAPVPSCVEVEGDIRESVLPYGE